MYQIIRKRLHSLLIPLTCWLMGSAMAQTGSVTGVLTDASSKKPIEGAAEELVNTAYKAITSARW